MRIYKQKPMDVPIVADVDVVVVGGGTAGSAAAISAARLGLNTLVVERMGNLGGVAVNALMGSMANRFFNLYTEELITGLPKEIVKRVMEKGGCQFDDLDSVLKGKLGKPFTVPFKPEVLSQVLLEMVQEFDVRVLLHTQFSHVIEKGNRPKGIVVVNKSGMSAILAKVIIDASGDADVAYNCGAPCIENDSDYGCLMRIGNVDFDKVMDYVRNNDKWQSYPEFNKWLCEKLGKSEEEIREKYPTFGGLLDPIVFRHAPEKKDDIYFTRAKLDYIIDRWEKERVAYSMELSLFREFIMQAVDNGDLFLEKIISGYGKVTLNRDGVAFGAWGEGIALCNISNPVGFDGGDGFAVSLAEIEGRKYNYEVAEFLKKYVPGFEQSYLLDMGGQFVPRDFRMIKGEKTLVKEDVTGEKEIIKDAIYIFGGLSTSCRRYGIPYKIIVPKKVDNILVAGKCASGAKFARSIASCMAMGQGAASAAKIMIEDSVANRDVDINNLQDLLEKQSVSIS